MILAVLGIYYNRYLPTSNAQVPITNYIYEFQVHILVI